MRKTDNGRHRSNRSFKGKGGGEAEMQRHLRFFDSLKRCQEPGHKNNSKEKHVTLEEQRRKQRGREKAKSPKETEELLQNVAFGIKPLSTARLCLQEGSSPRAGYRSPGPDGAPRHSSRRPPRSLAGDSRSAWHCSVTTGRVSAGDHREELLFQTRLWGAVKALFP